MKYLHFCVINTSFTIVISNVSKQEVFLKKRERQTKERSHSNSGQDFKIATNISRKLSPSKSFIESYAVWVHRYRSIPVPSHDKALAVSIAILNIFIQNSTKMY